MAYPHQLDRAFQDLGTLYAAEHAEGDDEGVAQVEGIVKLLRRFKQHEEAEHKQDVLPVREATYQLPDGRGVYYDDAKQSLRDAADLNQVVPELDDTGSPNLENLQARSLMDRIQTGYGLSEHHIGTLRGLLNKHADKIAALRKDRDKPDWLQVAPPTPESRIITAGEAH
jgi:hypothetical protein